MLQSLQSQTRRTLPKFVQNSSPDVIACTLRPNRQSRKKTISPQCPRISPSHGALAISNRSTQVSNVNAQASWLRSSRVRIYPPQVSDSPLPSFLLLTPSYRPAVRNIANLGSDLVVYGYVNRNRASCISYRSDRLHASDI